MNPRHKIISTAQFIFGTVLLVFFLALFLASCVFGPLWARIVCAIGFVGSAVSTYQGLRTTRQSPSPTEAAPNPIHSDAHPVSRAVLGSLIGGAIPLSAITLLNGANVSTTLHNLNSPLVVIGAMAGGAYGWLYRRDGARRTPTEREWRLFGVAALIFAALTLAWNSRGFIETLIWAILRLALALGVVIGAVRIFFRLPRSRRVAFLTSVVIGWLLLQGLEMAWRREAWVLAAILGGLLAADIFAAFRLTRTNGPPSLISEPLKPLKPEAPGGLGKLLFRALFTFGVTVAVVGAILLVLTWAHGETRGIGSLLIAGELILLVGGSIVALIGWLGRSSAR